MCDVKAAESEGSAGVPEDKIEVTPAMIEAGAEEIWSAFSDATVYGTSPARDLAKSVYLAMRVLEGRAQTKQI